MKDLHIYIDQGDLEQRNLEQEYSDARRDAVGRIVAGRQQEENDYGKLAKRSRTSLMKSLPQRNDASSGGEREHRRRRRISAPPVTIIQLGFLPARWNHHPQPGDESQEVENDGDFRELFAKKRDNTGVHMPQDISLLAIGPTSQWQTTLRIWGKRRHRSSSQQRIGNENSAPLADDSIRPRRDWMTGESVRIWG